MITYCVHKRKKASKYREMASGLFSCRICHNAIACEKCGNQYPLCSHCIDDDECPICASIEEENIKEAAGPNWKAYFNDPKQEAEKCEDSRGDGDVNNDGGFRVKRTDDDDQGEGNYDLEVNASTKIKQLERENQEMKLTLAKFAKAVETATVMAYGDAIDVTDIPGQVNKFMQDRSTNAAGLEHIRQTVAALAKKNSQTKLAGIEKGMRKGASAPKVTPVGFGFNPNPSQERQFDSSNNIKDALQGIFTCPRKSDDE